MLPAKWPQFLFHAFLTLLISFALYPHAALRHGFPDADRPELSQSLRSAAKQQFVILPIVQRMLERRLPIAMGKRSRIAVDRHFFRKDDCPDAAGLADMSKVAGKPIADVDHRRDSERREPPGQFHPRR